MKKRVFYTEIAYVIGLLLLSFGTALMEAADFGVSMVVAPAYLIYLKVSQFLPFFTFGMAEYMLQAVILIAMTVILRKFKFSYLFSFVTAVLYGLALDGFMLVVALMPMNNIALRLIFYIVGMLLVSAGVSLFFQTYISPEAYEMFVKEVSKKFNVNIHKFKTCYDCISCAVAIVMSFVFFGLWHFEGIKIGTVFCALLNGWIISRFTKLFNRIWTFEDKLKLRKFFE